MRIFQSKVEEGTLNGFVYKQLIVFLISHILIRLWHSSSLHTVAIRTSLIEL